MLGFLPLGIMPLGVVDDDGKHGQVDQSAIELDSSDAALLWMIEIDAVDLTVQVD